MNNLHADEGVIQALDKYIFSFTHDAIKAEKRVSLSVLGFQSDMIVTIVAAPL